MRDELLAAIGLLLLGAGGALVAGGITASPVVAAGVLLALLGAGVLVYALVLSPDKPEVS